MFAAVNLPDVFQHTNADELTIQLGAVVAALAVVTKYVLTPYVFRPLWQFHKKVRNAVTFLSHEMPEVAALVNKELKPNGGSSIYDAINRIDRKMTRVDKRLTAVEQARDPNARTRSTDEETSNEL